MATDSNPLGRLLVEIVGLVNFDLKLFQSTVRFLSTLHSKLHSIPNSVHKQSVIATLQIVLRVSFCRETQCFEVAPGNDLANLKLVFSFLVFVNILLRIEIKTSFFFQMKKMYSRSRNNKWCSSDNCVDLASVFGLSNHAQFRIEVKLCLIWFSYRKGSLYCCCSRLNWVLLGRLKSKVNEVLKLETGQYQSNQVYHRLTTQFAFSNVEGTLVLGVYQKRDFAPDVLLFGEQEVSSLRLSLRSKKSLQMSLDHSA